MPSEQAITELIIDASDVTAAESRVVSAFDHMGASAAAAQAKFDRMMEGQLRIGGSVPQAIDRVDAAYARLQGRLDPVVAAQQRAEREMVQSLGVINRAVLLGVATEQQAARDIARLKQQQIEQINRVRDAQVAANRSVAVNDNDPAMAGRRQVLGYQAFDIGQGLMAGTPLAIIAAQQGPQIAQLYAAQGGLNSLWKDTIGILGGLARAAAPWVAAAAAIYGAYKLIMSFSADAALAIDDTTAALAAQAAPIGTVQSGIGDLTRLQQTYQDAIRSTAGVSDAATSTIIANTEREFNAKKALLELERLRQEAALKVNDLELARAVAEFQKGASGSVFTRSDLERQGFADPRIGSVPFVRLPDDVTGVDKTKDLIENSPIIAKIKELRAQGELTRITYENLVEALKTTFDDGKLIKEDKSRDPVTGKAYPVPTLRGIDDAPDQGYQDILKTGAERLRQLQAEAEALGMAGAVAETYRFKHDAINQALRENIELTPQQIQTIEKQAKAYGATVAAMDQVRLQQDLIFERQQVFRTAEEQAIASRLRGTGIGTDSAEAQIMRDNAALERQVGLWQDIRKSGMDAYSDIFDLAFDGFDNWEQKFSDIAKDMAKQLFDLGVKNPFLNEQYPGANLPTMDQAGGIGGFISALMGGPNPASQAVGSMAVQAAVVNINGAGLGDLGGLIGRATGAGGLPEMAGGWGSGSNVTRAFAPANTNSSGVAALGGSALSFVGNYKKGVDAQLTEILQEAALRTPGYKVEAMSGFRPGDPRFHGKGLATDVQLWKDGIKLDNYQSADTFRDYEKFAQTARQVQMEKFPELSDKFRWGGYFSGGKGKYGANDPMHFDLGGGRVGMAGGSWDGGLTGDQRKLWPGIESLGMGSMATKATAATDALQKLATNSIGATQGLGTLGSGLDTFGKNLASAMPAGGGGSGGGGGGLFSWISNLFGFGGGGAPFVNTPGVGLYANGTENAPAGWAWVGEQGPELRKLRAGDVIRSNPRSMQMANAGSGVQVQNTTNVHNYAGVKVRTEESDDGSGGRRTDIIIEEKVASAVGRRGSAANKALAGMGLSRPTKVR